LATSRRTTASTLAGIALAALLLTGCSAGGSDEASGESSSAAPEETSVAAEPQTAEESCEILKAGVEDTLTELQSGLSTIQTDPDAAAAAVTSLAAAFGDTAEDVTNEDVRAVADDATTALTDFSAVIADYANDPTNADQTVVMDSATAVQDAMTQLQTTCP
jgi:PBP1b-binding outer membrane lipoprotein LpoB